MLFRSQVDVDTALRIESRYFTQLATGQISKNMIGTFWHGLNAIKSGSSRPQGIAPNQTQKVGILGAGMMGAGIAMPQQAKGLRLFLKMYPSNKLKKAKLTVKKY